MPLIQAYGTGKRQLCQDHYHLFNCDTAGMLAIKRISADAHAELQGLLVAKGLIEAQDIPDEPEGECVGGMGCGGQWGGSTGEGINISCKPARFI